MIEVIDLDKHSHKLVGTQAYMYVGTKCQKVTTNLNEILGSKVNHQHVIVSQTDDGFWVSPLSSIGHAPAQGDEDKRWNGDESVPFCKQYIGSEPIVCKRLCRPVHLFFYVEKIKLKQANIMPYVFDSAPNCKVVCLKQKPPKRKP